MNKADREGVERQINLGVTICSTLKNLYFSDVPWVECYKKIAQLFNVLKKTLYPMFPEKNKIEILIELNRYGASDLHELLSQGDSKDEEAMVGTKRTI